MFPILFAFPDLIHCPAFWLSTAPVRDLDSWQDPNNPQTGFVLVVHTRFVCVRQLLSRMLLPIPNAITTTGRYWRYGNGVTTTIESPHNPKPHHHGNSPMVIPTSTIIHRSDNDPSLAPAAPTDPWWPLWVWENTTTIQKPTVLWFVKRMAPFSASFFDRVYLPIGHADGIFLVFDIPPRGDCEDSAATERWDPGPCRCGQDDRNRKDVGIGGGRTTGRIGR